MKKALVCISRTPDTTAKIAFANEGKYFDEQQVQWIINPYDEWYAMGKALDLKQAGKLNQVDLVMVGSEKTEPVLRKAIALGGDDVFRIDHDPRNSFETASLLYGFAQAKNYHLILGGKETIDYNSASVMAMLAALLKVPFISQASRLDIENEYFVFTHSLQGKIKHGKVSVPIVVSCQKGLAEPRLPNMKGVMAARTKKIEILPSSAVAEYVKIEHMSRLEKKKSVQWMDPKAPQELFNILRSKHKLNV